MQIQLYGCYGADKRLSMDIYTSQLHAGLEGAGHSVSTFTPKHTFERWSASKMAMRYLRYRNYGHQVKQHGVEVDVSHIADHGYAHLHSALPKSLKVVTVHDLIPYLTWIGKIPSLDKVHKPRLNILSLKHLNRFDRIISVSKSTARDLTEVLKIPNERISVVPPPIASYFKPQTADDVAKYKASLDWAGDAKLVMLSGADHYKNLRTSLQVFKGLIDSGQDIQIIRTGFPNSDFSSLVDEFGLSKRVHSLFLTEHQELAMLYSSVDCLLFPSWYEGFGMPVVEALACGTAVVSSNSASLPEVGGDLALTAAPDDIDGLSNHILTCLHNSQHRERISKYGSAWADNFRTHSVTNRLIEAYSL